MSELTVAELKTELSARGLQTTGTKQVLIDRIVEALEEEGDDDERAVDDERIIDDN